MTTSHFLAGNREAEVKSTTFSSLLLFRVFLFPVFPLLLTPQRYSTFDYRMLGLLLNNIYFQFLIFDLSHDMGVFRAVPPFLERRYVDILAILLQMNSLNLIALFFSIPMSYSHTLKQAESGPQALLCIFKP